MHQPQTGIYLETQQYSQLPHQKSKRKICSEHSADLWQQTDLAETVLTELEVLTRPDDTAVVSEALTVPTALNTPDSAVSATGTCS